MEVGFRRKKNKKKTASEGETKAKKRLRREENESETLAKQHPEDEDDDHALEIVQEILEDQKLRRLHTSAKASKAAPVKAQVKAPVVDELSSYGLHDPKKDGSATKKLVTLLDGQFTGQSSTSQRDQHEELMHKYIEEKMRAKTQQPADQKDQRNEAYHSLQEEEDRLYALPDHLRVSSGSRTGGQEQQQQQDDESANGSVLVWSTGIAEVELPSDFQQHTVDATKKALQSDLSSKTRPKSHLNVESSALPTNFSTDFNRHRRDFVKELQQLPAEDKRERGFRKVGRDAPSDDLAVNRFRKQESRRKFR